MKQRERMTQFDEAYMETRKDMVENSPIFKRNVNDEMIARMQTKLQSIVNGEVEFEEPLTENEIKVGYGLIELLSNWEDLFQKMGSDKFNRTSVLYFLKEYTMLTTSEVRQALKRYRDVYFDLKQTFLKE